MKKEVLSSEPRLALLAHAPEKELNGGIKTFVGHLKIAFPQLEVFPTSDPPATHFLAKLHLKMWGLNLIKNDYVFSRILSRLHKKTPFDLLFTNSMAGLSLNTKRLGIPIIHIRHGCFAKLISQIIKDRWPRVLNKLFVTVDKKCGKGKYCIAVSKSTKNEISAFYGQDSLLIPMGVDLNFWQPQDKQKIRQQLNWKNIPTGLFVGRTEFGKGWDILLEVAKALPQVNFICFADTKSPPPLKNILLKQPVSSGELRFWYNVADFFFLPSRYECASYVTLEAMSSNLPLIVSDGVGSAIFGNLSPLGLNESVYLINNGIQGYVQAIQSCLEKRMHPQTRSFVEKHYSLERFCENYRQLVSKLLNTHSLHERTP